MTDNWTLIASFTVEGDPVGYTRQTYRGKWCAAARKYQEYQERVRNAARDARIEMPMRATKDRPLKVDCLCYFRNGHCPDCENVRKGAVDALFYASRHLRALLKLAGKPATGDKFTCGDGGLPNFDKDRPRVEVSIYERGEG